MSDYTVLSAASEALRSVLWADMNADPVLAPLVPAESAIVFANPTESAQDSANRLSLWLYQVSENEHLKNVPASRVADDLDRKPPLPLDLAYLLTPFGPSREADLLLLGKSMQTLYDKPIIVLRDPVAEIFEELRIVLARLTLEELTRVWESLREPYRLSVGYIVRVTRLDSLRERTSLPVVDRVASYGGLLMGATP